MEDGGTPNETGQGTVTSNDGVADTGTTEAMFTRDFYFGAVFGKTWGALKENPLVYLGLAAIATLPPVIMMSIYDWNRSFLRLFYLSGRAGVVGPLLVSFFITGLFAIPARGAVVYAVYQNARSRSVSFGEVLWYGIRRYPAMLVTMTVKGISIGAIVVLSGFLLGLLRAIGALIILAILCVFVTKWAVSLSVCVVEKQGPFRCLDRSGELTAGRRWKVFVFVVLMEILERVDTHLTALIAASTIFGLTFFPKPLSLSIAIPLCAYQLVLGAMLYYELRATKEGVDIESLAAVFD